MEKNITTALIVVAIVLLVSFTVWVSIDIQNKIQETENTITVSDTGEIYAKPDLALTTFSVITEEKTVAEALSKNTEKMNAVIDFVKSQGVEDKDLKTTSFNIYPRYEWHEEKAEIPPQPSGERVLVGYEIRQSLEVKIRDLEKIGAIIEGATEAGANQVGDLQFTIDKEDELKKQAREQAIEKAKTKAKELASQLGVNLVRIADFQESSIVPRYYGLEKVAVPGAGEAIPQIEIGENKIEVTVTITYEIN
ncbi:unnamed protein product [marine sediment metagenome]|uniref:26 kDa periplasmic immunogenic protein n=1 Tax=marine sediment metagenome TaxID=412755 RepID=X1GWG2_9ZZZZ